MNNETLKRDLCARLPYGVKVSYKRYKNEPKRKIATLTGYTRSDGYETTHRKYNGCVGDLIKEEGNNNIYDLDFKPILFSTSALTKPIQIASYNNGEPFVPILEIARLCANENFGIKTDTPIYLDENKASYVYQDVRYEFKFDGVGFSYDWKWKEWNKSSINQLLAFELLHKFHINYRLSPEQFIEVTDEFNPYK